jgi:hypothetical protein
VLNFAATKTIPKRADVFILAETSFPDDDVDFDASKTPDQVFD